MAGLNKSPERASPAPVPSSNITNNLAKANDLLEELQQEESHGFNLDAKKKDVQANQEVEAKSDDIADYYEEDFDDDIEEDIPEGGDS